MEFYFNLIMMISINVLLSMSMRKSKKQIDLLKKLPKVDYPFNIYKLDMIAHIGFILCIIISLLLIEVFDMEKLGFSLFLILLIFVVIVRLFGEIPTIDDNRYKIQVKQRAIGGRQIGLDVFSTRMGKYETGIIVYHYPIERDTIEVIRETDKEIIFEGRSISIKHGELPIRVELKSKLGKKYFKEFWNKANT